MLKCFSLHENSGSLEKILQKRDLKRVLKDLSNNNMRLKKGNKIKNILSLTVYIPGNGNGFVYSLKVY